MIYLFFSFFSFSFFFFFFFVLFRYKRDIENAISRHRWRELVYGANRYHFVRDLATKGSCWGTRTPLDSDRGVSVIYICIYILYYIHDWSIL